MENKEIQMKIGVLVLKVTQAVVEASITAGRKYGLNDDEIKFILRSILTGILEDIEKE